MKYLTKDINLSDKTVLIMGLGLNGGGVGTAKFLAPKVKKLIITDLKSKEELQDSIDQLKEFSNIEYKLNGHDINDFINVDIVFKGAGIKFTNQYIKAAIDNNVIVDTDIGYFFELADFPIIGITGSKGKSTTTTLIYEILKTTINDIILGGNITINPLTSLNENNNTKLAVLELSSWQLSDLSIHKKSPNISILTTIFPDHLNYYSSMEEYYGDKKYIFKFQKSDDYTIINIDNDYLYNSFINGEIKSNLIFVSNFDENSNIDKIDRIKKISINKIPFFIIKYKNYLYLFKNKSFFSISDIE
ncbi:MAG: Mur ligase family protein, partial [Spirochaetota bacterium]